MKKTLYVMLVAVMIITACQSKTKTSSNDADAIRNIEDQWAVANKTKDINKVVSLITSDAVMIEPNKPITVGIEAIKKSWELWFSDTTYLHNTYTQTTDNIEVSASGDLGYARGTVHYSLKTPNGTVEYVDKFVDIYKKINGDWKCSVGIWNTRKPIEGQ
jgi:ketosteroid isomerase-like protein